MPPIDPRLTRSSIQPEGTIAAKQVGKPGEFIGGKVELGKTYSEQVGPTDTEAMYGALQAIAGGVKTGLDAFSQIRTGIEEKELGEYELGASRILDDDTLTPNEKKEKFNTFLQGGPKNIWLLEGKKDRLTAGLLRESKRQFKTDEKEYIDAAYQKALERVREIAPGSAQPSPELLMRELQADPVFSSLLGQENITAMSVFNELAYKKNLEDVNIKNLEFENVLLKHTIPDAASKDIYSLIDYLKSKYDPNSQTFKEIVQAFSTVLTERGSYEAYLGAMLREIGVDKYIETTYGGKQEDVMNLFLGVPTELKIRPEDVERIRRIKSVIDKDFERVYSMRMRESNAFAQIQRDLNTDSIMRDPASDSTALVQVVDSYKNKAGGNNDQYARQLFTGMSARIERLKQDKKLSYGEAIKTVIDEFKTIPNIGFTEQDLKVQLSGFGAYRQERIDNVRSLSATRDSDFNQEVFGIKIFSMIKEGIPVNVDATDEDIKKLETLILTADGSQEKENEILNRARLLGVSDVLPDIRNEVIRWNTTQEQKTEKLKAEQDRDTADVLRFRLAQASAQNPEGARLEMADAIKGITGKTQDDPKVKVLLDTLFDTSPESSTKILDAGKELGLTADNLLPLVGIRTQAEKTEAQAQQAKEAKRKSLASKLENMNPDVIKGGKQSSFTMELWSGKMDKEVLDTIRVLSESRATLGGKLDAEGNLIGAEADVLKTTEEKLAYRAWKELFTPETLPFIFEMDRNYQRFAAITRLVTSEVTTSVSPEARQKMLKSYSEGDDSALRKTFSNIIYGKFGTGKGSVLPENPINEDGTWTPEAIQYMAYSAFLASNVQNGEEYSIELKQFMDNLGSLTANSNIDFYTTAQGKLTIATMLHIGKQLKANQSQGLSSSFIPPSDRWAQLGVILANVAEARSIEESITITRDNITSRNILVPLVLRAINGDRGVLPLAQINGVFRPAFTKPQGRIASALAAQPGLYVVQGSSGNYITPSEVTYTPNDPGYDINEFVSALQGSGILPGDINGSNDTAKTELSMFFRNRLLTTVFSTQELQEMSIDQTIREGLKLIYSVTSKDQRMLPDALSLYFSSWGPHSNPNFKYMDGEKKSDVFFDTLFTFMDINQLAAQPTVQLQFRAADRTSGFPFNETVVRTHSTYSNVDGAQVTLPGYNSVYTEINPENPSKSFSGNWFSEIRDYYRDSSSTPVTEKNADGTVRFEQLKPRRENGVTFDGDMYKLGSSVLTYTGFTGRQKVSTIIGYLQRNGWVNNQEELALYIEEADKTPGTLLDYWEQINANYGGDLFVRPSKNQGDSDPTKRGPVEDPYESGGTINISHPGVSELTQSPSYRLPTFVFSERELDGTPRIQINDLLFNTDTITGMRQMINSNNKRVDDTAKQLKEQKEREMKEAFEKSKKVARPTGPKQ